MMSIELIMVSENNSNKFYRMTELGDGNFNVEYGRIGVSSVTETYPMSRWNSKYNEKIRKGYRDVTDLKKQKQEGKILFDSVAVEHFYTSFSAYITNSVNSNYSISAGAVTPQMISEAQDIINQMVDESSGQKIDQLLLQLYTVLPRRMANVRDHLVKVAGPSKEFLDKKISKEQDILDSLASKIATVVSDADQTPQDLLKVDLKEEPIS